MWQGKIRPQKRALQQQQQQARAFATSSKPSTAEFRAISKAKHVSAGAVVETELPTQGGIDITDPGVQRYVDELSTFGEVCSASFCNVVVSSAVAADGAVR